jgi:hypothetical protein
MFLLDLIWSGIAGFVSAVFMTLVEYPFWRKSGMEGVAEWQANWVLVSLLYKKWRTMRNPILSLTIGSHLLHGVVAGVAFRLLLPSLLSIPLANYSIVLDAVLYGIALWFVFIFLGRGIYESAGKIRVKNRGLLAALLSDVSYGFFLGLLISIF